MNTYYFRTRRAGVLLELEAHSEQSAFSEVERMLISGKIQWGMPLVVMVRYGNSGPVTLGLRSFDPLMQGYRPWVDPSGKPIKITFHPIYREHLGYWKGAGMGDYLCSMCWNTVSGGNRFRFCPNCGHPMEVREDA